MTVTAKRGRREPKLERKPKHRITLTEARAQLAALYRDPEWVKRYLEGDAEAQREQARPLRIVARAIDKSAAKAKLRDQQRQVTKNVGESAISRLTWAVAFAQLRPDAASEYLDDEIKQFAGGPYREGFGPALSWPYGPEGPGGIRRTLAKFVAVKLKEFAEGGTSIRPADLGRFETRLDRFDDETISHFEGDGPAAFAMELARVLGEAGGRVRMCASQSCGRLFVHRKRGLYCGSRCSQRERIHRYRSKLTAQERYQIRNKQYAKSLPKNRVVRPRGPRGASDGGL